MKDETLEFFKGDKMAAGVWESKYNKQDGTPQDSIKREVKELNRMNEKLGTIPGFEDLTPYLDHYSMISTGGSFKAGAGTDLPVSLSNCFVISPPKDSIGGIQKTEEEIEQICKRRGGVGVDLSTLRPDGAKVHNAAKSSTGVVSVAEKYSNAIQYICQAGRRGALMISLSYLHPDVFEFVKAKIDLNKINEANISVRIDGGELYKRADADMDLILRFPIDLEVNELSEVVKNAKYGELVEIAPKQYIKKVRAKDLEELIARSAWKSAEPGVLFWDTICNESIGGAYPEHDLYPAGTNPCGEIPLPPHDSCRLTSINWATFIDNPYTPQAEINWEKIGRITTAAVIILDNIAELELEKVAHILRVCEDGVERTLWENVYKEGQAYRRLGLGPNGVADCLAELGIKYDSDKAIDTVRRIQTAIAVAAYKASHKLALIRGKLDFIQIDKELHSSEFIYRLSKWIDEDPREVLGNRRNIAILTAAPNGTNAMMQQVSSGIEPVFKIVMNRAIVINPGDKVPENRIVELDGVKKYIVRTLHPGFIRWYAAYKNIEEVAARQYLEDEVSDDDLDKLVKESPYYGSTSYEIDPKQKVRLQGAMQEYIDHSISVTHNLPEKTTVDDVKDIYRLAYMSGCKGATIYRDGSRTGVLDVKIKPKEDKPWKRPKELYCRIVKFRNNLEDWYGFVSEFQGLPYEVFTAPKSALTVQIPEGIVSGKIVKTKVRKKEEGDIPVGTYVLIVYNNDTPIEIGDVSRMCVREYFNYGRLISGLLRHHMPMEALINTLESLQFDNDSINSWKAGVIRAMKVYLKDGMTDKICPNCGSKMRRESGCLFCDNCGNSLCG